VSHTHQWQNGGDVCTSNSLKIARVDLVGVVYTAARYNAHASFWMSQLQIRAARFLDMVQVYIGGKLAGPPPLRAGYTVLGLEVSSDKLTVALCGSAWRPLTRK